MDISGFRIWIQGLKCKIGLFIPFVLVFYSRNVTAFSWRMSHKSICIFKISYYTFWKNVNSAFILRISPKNNLNDFDSPDAFLRARSFKVNCHLSGCCYGAMYFLCSCHPGVVGDKHQGCWDTSSPIYTHDHNHFLFITSPAKTTRRN